MKKQLLLTTALVTLVYAGNAYSADLNIKAGDIVKNPTTGVMDGTDAVNYDTVTINGGNLVLDNFKIRSNSDMNISGGNIEINGDGGLRAHNGTLNISGGTITADGTEIHGGITNVSGDAVINVNNYTEFGGDSELHIAGGTLNLSKGIVIVSPGNDGPIGKSLFEMTDGVINMEQSYLGRSKVVNDTERTAGTSNLLGGTINVNKGRNVFLMDNPTVGNTINIAENAILEAYKSYKDAASGNIDDIIFSDKTSLNLTDDGVVNLEGKLVADVSGTGNLNIKSSGATVDGAVKDVNLNIFADSSLSKAVTGTVGDLASLNVNKGAFTLDKKTGTIGSLNVAENAVLNVGLNKATIEGDALFNSGSILKIEVADSGNGMLSANKITAVDGSKLALTISKNMQKGDSSDVTLLEGEVYNNFAVEISNSRYEVKRSQDGKSYNITYVAAASDVVDDNGGSDASKSAAEAWDSMASENNAGDTAKEVAKSLNDLSQNNPQKYVEALTAIAPEVAPLVQKTSSEITNQVFNAVSSRLSGGSVGSAARGLSSGDTNVGAAIWAQGLYNKSKLSDTSKAKGFDADSTGAAMGIEKYFSRGKIGLGYAYTSTSIDGFMRDTDVDTHTAMIYGEYKPNNWYANAVVSYGWSSYSEKKNVAGTRVTADYDVDTLGIQAMTGYDIKLANRTVLTPEAGLRYVHISQDDYKDSAEQKVSTKDSDIVTGVVGAKFTKLYRLPNGWFMRPEARAAATYDLSSDKAVSSVTLANGSAYTVNGTSLERFGVEVGAGVAFDVTDSAEFSVGYEGKFSKDYQDHTGMLSAKYKF